MKANVEMIGGPMDGKEFSISKLASIGRDDNCDIVITTDHFISKKHAVIRFSDGGYILEDLDSTNGTFIDGTPVKKPALLRSGQVFKVGTTLLKIYYEN